MCTYTWRDWTILINSYQFKWFSSQDSYGSTKLLLTSNTKSKGTFDRPILGIRNLINVRDPTQFDFNRDPSGDVIDKVAIAQAWFKLNQ